MASITFLPPGLQLDNDEIADLQVKVGDCGCGASPKDSASRPKGHCTLVV